MRHIFAALILLFLPSIAQAQTGACPGSAALVVNSGGWVCITPGVDYNTTHLSPIDGVTQLPNVVRMDVLLFGPGVANTALDPATVGPVNVGKPARNAQGAVWVQVTEVTTIPVGQQYKARAVAVGQPLTVGGPAQVSARSPESNPFMRTAPSPGPDVPLGISVPAS